MTVTLYCLGFRVENQPQITTEIKMQKNIDILETIHYMVLLTFDAW